jgi:SH3 domain protein
MGGSKMKRNPILWVLVLSLCLMSLPSWAATAYVTDSLKITLRTGPGTDNKIISILSTGERVEVLETGNDWTRVRVLGSEGEQEEGWVLSRFLIERQPWEMQARNLAKETTSLKEKLGLAEKKWRESSNRARELQEKLEKTSESLKKVQADFDSLKNESSDFLKLKREYEAATSDLKTAQDAVQRLTKENEILESSKTREWLLTGALIFLGAWLIGLVIGRREKKRRRAFIR